MTSDPISLQDLQTPCPMCGASIGVGATRCDKCGQARMAVQPRHPASTVLDRTMATLMLMVTLFISIPMTLLCLIRMMPMIYLAAFVVDAALWGPTYLAFKDRATKYANRSGCRLLAESLIVGWVLLIPALILLIPICAISEHILMNAR